MRNGYREQSLQWARQLYFLVFWPANIVLMWSTDAPYFTFLPATEIAGFPALEFAVAETFGFSCFGFLISLLLFLPLAMVCTSAVQRSDVEMTKVGCGCHRLPIKGARWIIR